MKFIALLIAFVVSAAWITTTALHYGTVYRVEHEKMVMELLDRHRDSLLTPPPASLDNL